MVRRVGLLSTLLHEASDEGHIAGENAARLPDGVEAKPRRCMSDG